MTYSEDDLEHIQLEYQCVREKLTKLMLSYCSKSFTAQRSHEYATQGFLRRVKVLVHCIENVFERLPPDTSHVPSNDRRLDATVYLHAFVFNVFGCLDNLAHIWVCEKGVTEGNGQPLRNTKIGFRKKNKIVRESLPPAFRDYLETLEPWFEYLEDFRHALAHQRPLYIPPYEVAGESVPRYNEIEAQIYEAMLRGETDKVGDLQEEQKALLFFSPVMTHSFEEKAQMVRFHECMLKDFNTVDEIANRLLAAIG